MKKLLISVLFVVLVLGGVFWIMSSKTTQNIANNYINGFNSNIPKELKAKHSYTKEAGVLHIISDINYTKEFLNKQLLDDAFDQDLVLRARVDIPNSFFNLVNKYEANGTIEALTYKDKVEKIFGSPKFMDFILKGDKNSLGNAKITIDEVDYKDDEGEIFASKFVFDFDFENNLLKSINLTQNGSKLHSDEILISYDELNYEYNYEKPFDVSEILTHIANADGKSEIKNLKIEFDDLNFFIKNISQDDKITDNNTDKFEFNSILKAEGIDIKFEEDKLPVNKFSYDMSLKNIDKSFINKILNIDNSNISYEEIDKIGVEFLALNPEFSINNLNFNDVDGKDFNLNLKLGLENFDESKLLAITDYIFLSGDLTFSKKYFELVFNDLLTKEDMFKDAIVTSGILKEDGQNLKTKFKYDKSKLDIILNDNVSLMGLLMGFPVGNLDKNDDFDTASENLQILVSEMVAYCISQEVFADRISDMTHVKVDEISDKEAIFKVLNKNCVKISLKGDWIFEVSKGKDENDEICQEFYEFDEITKNFFKEHDYSSVHK